MNLLKRLFRIKPSITFRTAKIDEQVFLFDYEKHYRQILGDYTSRRRLAELFLFRAWTAQFGYRIFSNNAAASENLIGETVNSCHYVGLELFSTMHAFGIEKELGGDFLTLLEDRWWTFDQAFTSHSKEKLLPTLEIIGSLTEQLKIADPIVTSKLAEDFLHQLEFIKKTAFDLGIIAR